MRFLQNILFASLIPSAGLLGVVFAYLWRKRPTSGRGAVLWLVLILGSTLPVVWQVIQRQFWSDFRHVVALASFCAFAFVYPRGAVYWLRVARKTEADGLALGMELVSCLLFFLGIAWGGLIACMSTNIALTVWKSLR